MGKFFINTIATTLAVLFAGWILKGVQVDNTVTALVVAFLLGVLNTFIRPLLVFLTIPITIITLGFFLLIINIIIIKIVDSLVSGFTINSWFTALIFSLIVSFVSSLIQNIIGAPKDGDGD